MRAWQTTSAECGTGVLLALAVAAGLLAGAPAEASAQWGDILALQPGDSLRVRLPGAMRVHASMQGMSRDTLLLRTRGIDGLWPVSGFDLVTLEQYRDRTPRQGLRNGALLGLATGVFVGAAIGVGVERLGEGSEGEPSAVLLSSALRFAGLGAVGGAIVGGVMGGRRPGRGWIRLEVPVR